MTQEDENLDAFEKLLDKKEREDKVDATRYRYFEDSYNNQYRYTTHRQEDGKFHATILKYRSKNMWATYTKIKSRYFRKRKDAKSYCIKACRKATIHQDIVIRARYERKKERLDAKPVYSKDQLRVQEAQRNINNYKKLISKANTKMKTLTTRIKTYQKKTRVMQKRIDKVGLIA